MAEPKASTELKEPKELQVLANTQQMLCARFSPAGDVIAAGGMDGQVHRWKSGEKDFTPLPPLPARKSWLVDLAFHPDKPILFSGDSWGALRCHEGMDGEARQVWELEKAHEGWLRQVAADAQRVVSGGRDGAVRVWTHAGKPLAEWKGEEEIFCVTLHPDGKHVVFSDLKGRVRVWDFAAKKIVREMDASFFYRYDRIQDICGLRRLVWADGGKTLVAAGCVPTNGATMQAVPTVQFFDFASGKPGQKIQHGKETDGMIHDAMWHPGGHLIAVTSGQPGTGGVLFLRPGEDKPFYTSGKLANCQAVALHAPSHRMAVVATNRGSNGNGRPPGKDGEYPNNNSPVHVFALPAAS